MYIRSSNYPSVLTAINKLKSQVCILQMTSAWKSWILWDLAFPGWLLRFLLTLLLGIELLKGSSGSPCVVFSHSLPFGSSQLSLGKMISHFLGDLPKQCFGISGPDLVILVQLSLRYLGLYCSAIEAWLCWEDHWSLTGGDGGLVASSAGIWTLSFQMYGCGTDCWVSSLAPDQLLWDDRVSFFMSQTDYGVPWWKPFCLGPYLAEIGIMETGEKFCKPTVRNNSEGPER